VGKSVIVFEMPLIYEDYRQIMFLLRYATKIVKS